MMSEMPKKGNGSREPREEQSTLQKHSGKTLKKRLGSKTIMKREDMKRKKTATSKRFRGGHQKKKKARTNTNMIKGC